MKAGRTAGRNAMEDPAGVAPCRAGFRGERRSHRTAGGPCHRAGSAMTFGPEPGSGPASCDRYGASRSEEHTSELQSLMRISYAVFCLKTQKPQNNIPRNISTTTPLNQT